MADDDPRQGVSGHAAREDGLHPCCKHCTHDVPVRSYRRDGHALACEDCRVDAELTLLRQDGGT